MEALPVAEVTDEKNNSDNVRQVGLIRLLEWWAVRCRSKNGDHKDMSLKEIGEVLNIH